MPAQRQFTLAEYLGQGLEHPDLMVRNACKTGRGKAPPPRSVAAWGIE
jgi:hypothetical protein